MQNNVNKEIQEILLLIVQKTREGAIIWKRRDTHVIGDYKNYRFHICPSYGCFFLHVQLGIEMSSYLRDILIDANIMAMIIPYLHAEKKEDLPEYAQQRELLIKELKGETMAIFKFEKSYKPDTNYEISENDNLVVAYCPCDNTEYNQTIYLNSKLPCEFISFKTREDAEEAVEIVKKYFKKDEIDLGKPLSYIEPLFGGFPLPDKKIANVEVFEQGLILTFRIKK